MTTAHATPEDVLAPDSSRIVVGVDGSPHSTAALQWALRQAVLTGAPIEALACWHRPTLATSFVPDTYFELDLGEPTGQAAQVLVEQARDATAGAHDVAVTVRVVEGSPARVLLATAADAALLVVGSRGHGEVSGMLLGSVGLHCATHAACPVVIVHDASHPASS